MLAQHRCEETISEIVSELKISFDKLNYYVDREELETVVSHLKSTVEGAYSEYFEKLHRYPINIVQSKLLSLQRRIKELVEPLFQNFCSKIERKSIQIFELDLKSTSQQLSKASLHEATQRALIFYRSSIQG